MLRGLTIGFLSILFLFSLNTAILGFASQELLEPQLYEDALEENHAYEKIDEIVASQFFVPVPTRHLMTQAVMRTVLYVRGDTQELDLVFDLDNQTRGAILTGIQDLPACEQGESEGCIPEGINHSEYAQLVLAELEAEGLDFNAINQEGAVDELRSGVQAGRIVLGAAIIVCLLCLLLVFFLTRGHPGEFLSWLDGDLFVTGLNLVAIGWLLQRYFYLALPTENETVINVASSVMEVVFDAMLIYGAAILAIAAVLFGIKLLAKKHKEDEAVVAYENAE